MADRTRPAKGKKSGGDDGDKGAGVLIHLTSPAPGLEIPEGTIPLRVEGLVRGPSAWLDAQGLPRWKKPAVSKGVVAPAEVVRYESDPTVVISKALQVSVDGVPVTTLLGPRRGPREAGFFAEISGVGLSQGTHVLSWSAPGLTEAVGTRLFQVGPNIVAQQAPDVALGLGNEDIQADIPPFVEPRDFTRRRFGDINRGLPRNRPSPREERELYDRLRRRYMRLRAAFPGKRWVPIPPTHPITNEWDLVSRDCLELWIRVRDCYARWRRFRQRWRDDRTRANRTAEREAKEHYEEAYQRYLECRRCCCGCVLCIRVVRLEHADMLAPPTAAQVQTALAEVNRMFERCCIAFELSGDVQTLTLERDEQRMYFNSPESSIFDAEGLLRRLALRTRSQPVFSGTCINIMLARSRFGSLGQNSRVDGGVGGYAAGTPGVLALPQGHGGTVPRHVLSGADADSLARVLGHELAHILCLGDQYHTLYDVFPQPEGLSRQQRADRAFAEATEWYRTQEAAVTAAKGANPNLTDAQARTQVRDDLSDAQKRVWDRVYNLMAFGTGLSCEDCRRMCDCIRQHYRAMCS